MTEMTRGFCWHQNFVPWGCLSLTCSYIHLLNHEKLCINSEEEILFNLQQMTIVIRPSCWLQNFGPNRLSAPAQGLCLNFFSSITTDFNISSALRWTIQDQWSSGFMPPITLESCILGSWNFIYGYLMEKIADPYFFLFWVMPFFGVMPLLKNEMKILLARCLKNYLS